MAEIININESISNIYYDLTASEKKIAEFIESRAEDVQQMSITELAEACGTAVATVSRFSRKLGYEGFSALRIAVAQSARGTHAGIEMLSGEIETNDTFAEAIQKIYQADVNVITQTYDLIRPEQIIAAADLLVQADRVYCMGQGGSMIMAFEAAHLFSTAGNKFMMIPDCHLQAITASNMDENDVIFFFSYSGSVTDMLETLKLAKERKGKTILVTRFPKCPGAEFADVVLQCGSNESPLQLGSVPARLSQLFLLDILFTEYCRRDIEGCIRVRERIAGALADKHL